MNEFYVAESSSCDGSGDLRFLLGHFGPQAGRYLADYPSTWVEDVRKHCDSLGPLEGERIKVILRRAREKAALLRNSALPWDNQADWIENVRNVLRQRPGAFAQAIASRSRQAEGMPTIDDLDLSPTADESIPTTASEYVRVSKTLLLVSPELIFVDPYLNPCKTDRRDVLTPMFATAAIGKCQRISCWARASEVIGERRHTWDEVVGALDSILEAAGWPKDRTFRYLLVDDQLSKFKMHPRYMFSIKGGIRYDQGFQRLSKDRRNEVSPVGASLHDELLKTYHEGGHDMVIEHEYQHRID